MDLHYDLTGYILKVLIQEKKSELVIGIAEVSVVLGRKNPEKNMQ